MPEVAPQANAKPAVGVDVGLLRLATLSDGRRYENQRPLRHLLKKLRRLNKELARRTKGGKNWHKTKGKLGRLHSRIACLRHDLLHKLTSEIAKTASLVAVEDLHVKENKVPRAGGTLIKVDRFYPSSQLCHCCGARREDLQLSEREYACPACGYVGDRDENASWNILQEALRLVGT
jgi:putative transposase